MRYILLLSVPYEGTHEIFVGNRDEVKAYLQGPESPDLDDLELVAVADTDVYELFNEK
jgi:hypothetical protein